MYRSLLGFINLHGVIGEVTNAFSNGIYSALIILCISLGVAVPNIFARRYIAKDRQRYLQEELEKRRQRGKFIEWWFKLAIRGYSRPSKYIFIGIAETNKISDICLRY